MDYSLVVAKELADSLEKMLMLGKIEGKRRSVAGESQGRGSLVVCRLWGRTESDTTEAT